MGCWWDSPGVPGTWEETGWGVKRITVLWQKLWPAHVRSRPRPYWLCDLGHVTLPLCAYSYKGGGI